MEKLTLKGINHDNVREYCRAYADKNRFKVQNQTDYVLRELIGFHSGNDYLSDLVLYLGVKPSGSDPMLIEFWEYENKPSTKIAPGKFLKKVAPWLSCKVVESFVLDYKATYSKKEFEVFSSDSDFAKVYKMKVVQGTSPKYKDFGTDFETRYLSGSCMQKNTKFSNLSNHPAAAYASGDFLIYYVVEKGTGLLMARCVVSKRYGAGPIYTEYDPATEALIKALQEAGIQPKQNQSWDGDTLLYIESGYGGPLIPYVDCASYFNIDGETITVGGAGDYQFSTCGYATIKDEDQYYCEYCAEFHDSESVAYDENNNRIGVCDSCLGNSFFRCSLAEEYHHNSNMVQVRDHNGSIFDASIHCVEYDELIYIKSIDEYCYPQYCVKIDCDWYLKDDCQQYNGEYFLPDNTPEYLEKVNETEYRLKDNWELDENRAPVKNPELALV